MWYVPPSRRCEQKTKIKRNCYVMPKNTAFRIYWILFFVCHLFWNSMAATVRRQTCRHRLLHRYCCAYLVLVVVVSPCTCSVIGYCMQKCWLPLFNWTRIKFTTLRSTKSIHARSKCSRIFFYFRDSTQFFFSFGGKEFDGLLCVICVVPLAEWRTRQKVRNRQFYWTKFM